MKKTLCKPCALGLSSTGVGVKPIGARHEKITCEECGRRRFGLPYEVTQEKKKKRGE